MNILLAILAAAAAIVMSIIFWKKPVKPAATPAPAVYPNGDGKNPYPGLRGMALSITPAQIGVQVTGEKIKVYGIVMDLGMNGGTATVTAFETGDASMYFSSGGGVLGGRGDEEVRKAAIAFVEQAQVYVENKPVEFTQTSPLPATGNAIFYVLTDRGKIALEDSIANLEKSISSLSGLFWAGNMVLTGLRLMNERMQGGRA